MQETSKLYNQILERLPHEPKGSFWAEPGSGTILCKTAEKANCIADFLEAMGVTDCAVTGYYDPAEDARSGESDALTGWHYVDI